MGFFTGSVGRILPGDSSAATVSILWREGRWEARREAEGGGGEGERRISWDPRWILIWNSPEIGSDYANQVVSGNEDSICRWDSYRILWEGRRRKGRREGSKREIRTTTKKEIKRKG